MQYQKPNLFLYRVAQGASWVFSKFVFKRQLLRNEIKGKQGPFVVLANHQAAFDFVNLICANRRPMHFVVSNAFYQTLPVKGIMDRIGVIPKQQFQTSVNDLKQMRAAIQAGQPVVIYPAGLMCEDGLSTPIPSATYKLLKWLDTDVYVARTQGTYFAMPKWTSGFRPGKTTLDIYKLFDREQLQTTDLEQIREKTRQALLFDAYREQELLMAKYRHGSDIRGLQNVLYMCPHCQTEFSICAEGKDTLVCDKCGYRQTADAYGFFQHGGQVGQEMRYASDWSQYIHNTLKQQILENEDMQLSADTDIHMIDCKKNKFRKVGHGRLTLNKKEFVLSGTVEQEAVELVFPTECFPTLPFSPGKYLELQKGKDIYRCVLEDGRLAMKFIHMVKIFHENRESTETCR